MCLHNFLISDELVQEAQNRVYAHSNLIGGNENNEPGGDDRGAEEIANEPRQAVHQRQILADYFESEEGALYHE